MKVCSGPSYEILTPISDGGIQELKFIERIGRVCYKSEDRITEDGQSAKKFIKTHMIDRGHESVLEHGHITVKVDVDRGVSHEWVRHRIAAYSQESTRYCNYTKEKFGGEITVIAPPNLDDESYGNWRKACKEAEKQYFKLLNDGVAPEIARGVLPHSLKTTLIATHDYREWRNIFRARTAYDAHPQIRQIMIPLLDDLRCRIPVIFDDIKVTGKLV